MQSSFRSSLAAAAVVSLGLVASIGTSLAQSDPPPKAPRPLTELGRTLAGLAEGSLGGAQIGIAVVDVLTGAEVFASGGDTQLNPASNAKIVTASCALEVLGPEFRFESALHGDREDAAIRGSIYFKGHADPTLSTADLLAMAAELKAMGVRRVEGDVVVDDTYFDEQNLPFAFDQQPNEENKFRAPVGAASLNENALAITIGPGSLGMERARVVLDPPGYAALTNDAVTVGQGANDPKISSDSDDGRMRLRVYGQVPLGTRPVTYYRRIDTPSLLTGYGVKAALEQLGISVGGDVRVGPLPSGTPMLAEHVSAPLSSVLWETGKMSNNYVTETVLKTMGAETGKGPATWASATEAAAVVLEKWGLARGSYTYRNGSGLFDADRFSARQFVKVLRGAYLDTAIRPEFLTQLATGGVDGTIGERYRGPATKRHVRAKTGTLQDVSALSGYVFDAEGRRPIAFSILVNKADGYVSSARTYQEKIVTAIAEFLNP